MTDIYSLSFLQLQEYLVENRFPKFRAGQIYSWIHQRFATSFDEMNNIPKELRNFLGEHFVFNALEIEKKLVSEKDGTVKYLYKLADGNLIETVVMEYKHGSSVCISTQVGCKMGCKFCASAIAGHVRDLTVGELLMQIYCSSKDLDRPISGVVLMGVGEPLDNYDNVLQFLEMLSCKEGRNMSLRHVSLSTSGIIDKIDMLAKEKFGLTLSISLHAADNKTRDRLMPVNHAYKIEKLIASCKNYIDSTGRRISIEYIMIDGVNDSAEDAKNLAQLLKGMICHVNLIPANKVKERQFRPSSREKIDEFVKVLTESGITATVRRKMGADINAACGQLRRSTESQRV